MVPLMAALLLLASMLVLGAAKLGSAVVSRARADSIADVVALAAVPGGRGGATAVAAANGASIVNHQVRADGSTMIEIRLGQVSAKAAAADNG